MSKRTRAVSLVLISAGLCVVVGLIALAAPGPTYASGLSQMTCPNPPNGVVVVDSVEPGSIKNSGPVTLTIVGQGFDQPDSIVVLPGYSALQTTVINGNLLTAEVPSGIPGKEDGKYYDVMVLSTNDPSSNCDVIEDGLKVKSPATSEPTETPELTSTPAPTNFVRPSLAVQSYGASSPTLTPGQNVDFEMTLQNPGQVTATNVTATFVTGDLIPRETGGTQVLPDLPPGETYRFFQPLRVNSSLWAYEAILKVEVSYTDQYGTQYQDSFDLAFPVSLPASTPTPTATLNVRPDVIIETYTTNPAALAAGDTLTLTMDVANVSPLAARQVSLSLTLGQTSAEVLAPLTSGNQRYIERLEPGARTTVAYDLAISGGADAGLYPVDFELSYLDDNNQQYTETQSLTLRVETRPLFYIALFDDLPETINIGDTFEVPVQIINIGEASINVNTVDLVSDTLTLTDSSLYLGQLDAGTSGSLIASATATASGPAVVTVNVNYLDAFQRPQVYSQDIPIEVQGSADAGELQPGEAGFAGGQNGFGGQGALAGETMTVGQRITQAILGFFGLATRENAGATFQESFDAGAGE